MLKFDYIELTGMSKEQVLKLAKKNLRYMEQRFGKGCMTLQDCIHSQIDAAAEFAQGQM